jgi:hypothetical protein
MEVSHRSRRSSWGKSSPKFPSIDPPASSGCPPSIFPGPTSAMADLLCDKQSGVGEVFLRLRNRPPFQLLQQSLTRIVAPEPPHLRPSLRRSSHSRFDPTGVPLLVRLWRDGLMRPSGLPCGEMQMRRRHLLSRACSSFSSFHVCLSQRRCVRLPCSVYLLFLFPSINLYFFVCISCALASGILDVMPTLHTQR